MKRFRRRIAVLVIVVCMGSWSPARGGESYRQGISSQSAQPLLGWVLRPSQAVLPPSVVAAPAPSPAAITLTPMQSVTAYRWGFFHRRIVPRTRYVPGQPVTYVPQPPPTGPAQQESQQE